MAVSQVSWRNNRGGSGTASGTDNWSAANISLAQGQNTITVTAQDAVGNTGSDSLTVTYTALDTTAPAIFITIPTNASTYTTKSTTIGLAGTASDDKQLARITWSSDRGVSGTAVGSGIWSVASISLAEGDNVITVTAHDVAGNSTHDTLTVTCNQRRRNSPPLANAGADQTVTQPQLATESVQVALDGSRSSDPDGDTLAYAWRQIQGSRVNLIGASTVSPFFSVTTALAGQTLAFELTVHDGQIASDPDTVIVDIADLPPPPNEPPVVQVGATPSEGVAPLAVSFSGTATDSDGTITGCVWNFGDGKTTTVEKPAHTYSTAGTYTAVFTATDDDGATASTTVRIVVTAPPENEAPTVSITADPTTGEAPVTVPPCRLQRTRRRAKHRSR